MALDPVRLAQALIRCPSVTPHDAGALKVLADVLEPLGFTCHFLPFGDVMNLFARYGTGSPHLCFCGHTDVVPPGDEKGWTHPPFGAVIENGRLYGRGAADMKGGIACFIAAVAGFLSANPGFSGSLSLLITGDEEGASVDGTVRVLPWMKENGHIPDVAVVGEPSNPKMLGDEIKIGRRGSFNGSLTVRGVQGHTAYPARADNSLPRLIAMAQALLSHEFDKGTKFFPPTNLQITSIDVGNSAYNVIPAGGSLKFNVRFCDLWDSRTLEQRIRSALDAVSPDYELAVHCNAESFMTKPGPFTDMAVAEIRAVTGRAPALTTGGGTSDARFVHAYCPVVEFGLINETIHRMDENAALDDLAMLTEIYARILARYFSG